MSDIVHIENNHHFDTLQDLMAEFKSDVHSGLEAEPKSIPSKYLYDDLGCKIFNKITRHPDYYLTRCEFEILNTYKEAISTRIATVPFNLVELGPGEGIKTRILINQFIQDSLRFTYSPIDINTSYLRNLINQLKVSIPALQSKGLHSDYFDGLSWISNHSSRKNLILFLGGNIGNFDAETTQKFLQRLHDTLNPDDLVLIGFDLCKEIDILMRAYNDSDGITRDFNLNLLQRMNRELGANFNLNKFEHYPLYNPKTLSMESYLISLQKQRITFNSFAQSFAFNDFDAIHLEYSRKYQLSQLDELASATGFTIVENFLDSKKYFVDSLWQVRS